MKKDSSSGRGSGSGKKNRSLQNLDRMSKQDLKELVRRNNKELDELKRRNEELGRKLLKKDESLQRYTDLYDQSPVGCFSLDKEGNIRTVNTTGAAMLSSEKSDLAGASFQSYVYEGDKEVFGLHIQNVLQGDGPYYCDLQLRKGKEGCFHAQLGSRSVRDSSGSILELRTTVSDITTHKLTEEKLHRNQAILRAIIDATDVMLVYLDPDFNFIWVNPAYAGRLGMKPEDLAGKNHFALYPDKENEDIFRRVRDTGNPVFFKDKPFEFSDRPELGVTYWDWSLVPHKNEAGEVIGLVFSLRETTKFKQAQLELAESEERFRRITETSSDIIFQMDLDGVLTYCSPAIKLFGYKSKEVIKHSFAEFIPENELSRAMGALEQVKNGEKITLFDLKILQADGSIADCEISATPIFVGDRVFGVQGVARDITERVKDAESIRQHALLLESINKIFTAGLHCETDEELALETLQVIEQITGSDFGLIAEIGPDNELRDIAISSPGREQHAATDKTGHRALSGSLPVAGLCDKVLLEGVSVLTNDPASHVESVGPPAGHLQLSSFLGVPLLYDTKPIGLIALANRPGGYGETELKLIQGLAPAFVETLFKSRFEKALRESESRAYANALQLKQFLDSAPIPIWIAHDKECRNITGNLAAADLMGFDVNDNVSQTPDVNVVTPTFRHFQNGRELPAEELPLQYAVTQKKKIDNVDVRIEMPNGEEREMLGAAVPLFDENGEVQGAIASYLDITERKQVEASLRKKETQLRTVFDNINEGLIISDMDGNLLQWNPAAIDIHGFSSEDEYLRSLHDFRNMFELSTDSDGILTFEQWPLNRILRGITLEGWEVNVRRLDIDWQRTLSYSGTLAQNEEGESILAILALSDITERKWVERQLIRAKNEWEQTFDSVPDLIAILDDQHRIVRANRAMAERMKITPGECVSRKCFSCVHESDEPLPNCPHTLTLQDGKEHRAEVYEDRLGGHFLVSTTPLRDEKRNIFATVHVARDITDRKITEDKIKQLNLELQKNIELLEQANTELARSNWDLEQFVNIASHDLQEPLRTISSFVQLLKKRYRGQLDDKADTFIDFVIDGAAQMQRLINDLLAFSRVGGGELTVKPIAVQSLLDKLLISIRTTIEENEAEIIIDNMPIIHGDESQITLLMQNLISNAIKFRKVETPRLHIFAEQLDNDMKICVRDNGIGIDPQYADQVFLIFHRLHRREEFSGTGIGLAICKKIVERHGGRIWVESQQGKGSTFCFTLPINNGKHDAYPSEL